MVRPRIAQLLIFFVLLPLITLSETDLNARTLVATSKTPSASQQENPKPLSYSQFRQSGRHLATDGNEIGTQTLIQPAAPPKSIVISLQDQRMWVFEGNRIVQRFLVSTGVPSHRTPTGEYSVHRLSPRAWSNKYECYMPHWMAITGDGQYGMHALEGRSYLRHLGSVASHGCIRLAPENATWLYGWVAIGTPVSIVADYVEPPEQKSLTYRTGKDYCL